MGDSSAARSRPHWAAVATRLKIAHIAAYPATRTNAGATGLCCAAALRATAAYSRVIGTAVGTIMATIITAHIASRRPNSAAVHGAAAVMACITGTIGRLLMSAWPPVIRRAATTM